MYYNSIRAIIALLFIGIAASLCGCGEKDPLPSKKRSIEQPFFDNTTGAEPLRTYQKTKSKVGDINEKLKSRYGGF